jgi:hypothetical protein
MPPENVRTWRFAASVRSNAPGKSQQPREQHNVFGAGEIFIHRCELPGHSNLRAHFGRFGYQIVSEHACAAAIGLDQRGEHADGGGLARAIRAEQAIHLAASNGDVDAVHGARGTEALREPSGFDGERHGELASGYAFGKQNAASLLPSRSRK